MQGRIRNSSTAMVMNQFGGYFERAERMRNEAIAFAIEHAPLDEGHLEREPSNKLLARRKKSEKNEYCVKLLAARALYRQAIAEGDYRAVCNADGRAQVGAMGGLLSLNGLLSDAGLLSKADENYFQKIMAHAIGQGNRNCQFLKKEQDMNELRVQEKIEKFEKLANSSFDLGLDDDVTEDYSLIDSGNSNDSECNSDLDDVVDLEDERLLGSSRRM